MLIVLLLMFAESRELVGSFMWTRNELDIREYARKQSGLSLLGLLERRFLGLGLVLVPGLVLGQSRGCSRILE